MIQIVSPKTREDFKTYYDIRYKVLREPWAQPKGTEKDDFEPISQHFMAVDEATGKIVGVIKLMEKEPGVGWFSHMAVVPSLQRKGIGKLLLKHVEEEAKRQGQKTLGCLSRLNTTAYFEKAGYMINGMPSHYFGTTQVVWMEKKLST
jgi:GNAT superfamily N-acetyltransferase